MSQIVQSEVIQAILSALQTQGEVSKHLKKMIQEIKNKNIPWTITAISTCMELLSEKDETLEIKSRTLQIVKICCQTCEYIVMVLVQVYLLPLLKQLVKSKKSSQQAKNMDLNIKEKFQQLVYQIIELCSVIKPYRTIQTHQLPQKSKFVQFHSQLKQQGLRSSIIFKKGNDFKKKKMRELYISNLKSFSDFSQNWSEHLVLCYHEQLHSEEKPKMAFRQLLLFGQSYLTSPILSFCQQQLLLMTQNFETKKKYLIVFNELIRNGDIQAVILIKNNSFIPLITQQISKVKGHIDLSEGQKIYPSCNCPKKIKRQFYQYYLKSLQIWTHILPSDFDESSNYKLQSIYQYLKSEKKFKFPSNNGLEVFQKEFTANMEKNKHRNDYLLSIMKYSQEQYSSSQYKLQKDHIYSKLSQIKIIFDKIQANSFQIEENIQNLQDFKNHWELYLEKMNLQQEDDAELQSIINQGQIFRDRIQQIFINLNLKKQGKITISEYRRRLSRILSNYKIRYSLVQQEILLSAQQLQSKDQRIKSRNDFQDMPIDSHYSKNQQKDTSQLNHQKINGQIKDISVDQLLSLAQFNKEMNKKQAQGNIRVSRNKKSQLLELVNQQSQLFIKLESLNEKQNSIINGQKTEEKHQNINNIAEKGTNNKRPLKRLNNKIKELQISRQSSSHQPQAKAVQNKIQMKQFKRPENKINQQYHDNVIQSKDLPVDSCLKQIISTANVQHQNNLHKYTQGKNEFFSCPSFKSIFELFTEPLIKSPKHKSQRFLPISNHYINKKITQKTIEQTTSPSKNGKQLQKLRHIITSLQKESKILNSRIIQKSNQLQVINHKKFKSTKQFSRNQFSPSYQSQKNIVLNSLSSRQHIEPIQQKLRPYNFKKEIQAIPFQISESSLKKSLITNKFLVAKTENVQIGCIQSLINESIQATFYITCRIPIKNLKLSFQKNNNLNIHVKQSYFQDVKKDKQIKIHVNFNLVNIPSLMPIICMQYINSDKLQIQKQSFIVAIGFNKFCKFQKCQPHKFNFQKLIHKSSQVKIDKLFIKRQNLNSLLPKSLIINSVNENVYQICSEINFSSFTFFSMLSINQEKAVLMVNNEEKGTENISKYFSQYLLGIISSRK